MQTTIGKTIRCPQCRTKNAADAHRCRTCTRPLDTVESSSNADFERQLWSDPITLQPPRQPVSRWLIVAMLLVGLGVANYYWIGQGPSWAHVAKPVPKGSDWQTYADPGGRYRVAMPGDPEIISSPTPAGTMTISQTWVNDHWDAIRDRHTKAVGPLTTARETYFAVVAVGTVAAPKDPLAGASQLVAAMEPPMSVTDLTTTEVSFPSVGRQFDVTGHYANWPDEFGKGTVEARVVVDGTNAVVIAAFYRDQVDPALLDRLIDDYLAAPSGS